MAALGPEELKIDALLHPEWYQFSQERGSLIEDEDIGKTLAKIEVAGWLLPYIFGKKELYDCLESLGAPGSLQLELLNKRQLHRAMKRYAFLVSAYLKNHLHGKLLRPDLNVIPTNLARPFVRIAQLLGVPPILSYHSYCQANWKLKDPAKGFKIQNLNLEQSFIDSRIVPDEVGFIIPHTMIEYEGRNIPFSVGLAKEGIHNNDISSVITELWNVACNLVRINSEMDKMPDWCDPNVYFKDVRPQIKMFTDIVFEGCADMQIEVSKNLKIDFSKPVTLRGETGAQSPLMAMITAFLDIPEENDGLRQFTQDMRNYMLPTQRRFIEIIEETPSVRKYVIQHGREHPELLKGYNGCAEERAQFLKTHYRYAEEYIFSKERDPTGTGGTPFQKFLGKHVAEADAGLLTEEDLA